jgi:hypothetical protein
LEKSGSDPAALKSTVGKKLAPRVAGVEVLLKQRMPFDGENQLAEVLLRQGYQMGEF